MAHRRCAGPVGLSHGEVDGHLHEHLASASPDLLRSLLTTCINTLMSAEADAVCGAPYGQSSPDRSNVRNGYRHREFDTRAGTLDVAIPSCATVPTSPTVRMISESRPLASDSFPD